MVRNNIMMHLCTVATLCFFKITFPEITIIATRTIFPGSVFLKYVSKSNCCHRHLVLYISMSKSFHTYRKYIYQQSTKTMQENARYLEKIYSKHKFTLPPVAKVATNIIFEFKLNNFLLKSPRIFFFSSSQTVTDVA